MKRLVLIFSLVAALVAIPAGQAASGELPQTVIECSGLAETISTDT